MKLHKIETRKFAFTQEALKEALGIKGPGELVIARITASGTEFSHLVLGDDKVELRLVYEDERDVVEVPPVPPAPVSIPSIPVFGVTPVAFTGQD